MDCEVIEYTNSTNSTIVVIHNYFSLKSIIKPHKVLNYINTAEDSYKELVPILNET